MSVEAVGYFGVVAGVKNAEVQALLDSLLGAIDAIEARSREAEAAGRDKECEGLQFALGELKAVLTKNSTVTGRTGPDAQVDPDSEGSGPT